MKIPSDLIERYDLYTDVMQACASSREPRKGNYKRRYSYFVYGAQPEVLASPFNKIGPALDALTSLIFSAETTRFSIELGVDAKPVDKLRTMSVSRQLSRRWNEMKAGELVRQAVLWALAYDSMFLKLLWRGGRYQAFLCEPHTIGLFRDDVTDIDEQEAISMTYGITIKELTRELASHPRRAEILKNVSASQRQDSTAEADGLSKLVVAQIRSDNPTNLIGNLASPFVGTRLDLTPTGQEQLVPMTELWIWDDDKADYRVVTLANDMTVYDRFSGNHPGEPPGMWMKGEHQFIQFCPEPKYDYAWGFSQIDRLMDLQDWRTRRMREISDVLSRNTYPPKISFGVPGIQDEKAYALGLAKSYFAVADPMGKIEEWKTDLPQDLFIEIREIDAMFDEALGLPKILQGEGTPGVRSRGHAETLGRYASGRARSRSQYVESAVERLVNLMLQGMRVHDATHLPADDGTKFIVGQFDKVAVAKVDAHSSSPVFVEELDRTANELFEAGAIDRRTLLELRQPPMLDMLLERLKDIEEKEAKNAQMQMEFELKTKQAAAQRIR